MPATYEPIASTTLSSAASSFTFSSIPGTYTDLVLVHSGLGTGGAGLRLRFNSDTGSNYSNTQLHGNGTTAASTRDSSATSMRITYDSSIQTTDVGARVAHIMSYANTNVFKTVLSASARAGSGVDRIVGLWRSTSAITSVTVLVPNDNMDTGTTLSLYGIKAA